MTGRLLKPTTNSYFAYIYVENIDALYNELLTKEIEFPSKIEDKPWGQREFSIRTIDGHRIMFGEEIKSPFPKEI